MKLMMLASLLFAAGALSLAASFESPQSRSAMESNRKGWTDIMPRPDLKGWTRVPIPPDGKLGREQWHVDPQTGYLVCDGDGGHDWLRYDRELGDLVLHVEWRYTPVEGRTGYNSGIFIRNSADGAVWHQAQIGSRSGGYLFGVTPKDGKNERFNLSGQLPEQRVREAGEWNTTEVTALGNTLLVWTNGAETSRFSNCTRPKGYLGLEGEGYRIEFRSLRIRKM